MRRSAPAAVLAAVLLTLSGCGTADDAAAPAATSAPVATAAPSAPEPTTEPTTEPDAAAASPAAEPEPTAAPDDAQVVELTVAGGQITGDTGRVEVPLGTDVRLTITSDTADEVHVHGFELTEQLPPGQPVSLEFVADQAGVFEIELHDARRVLTRLQVS